MESKLTQFYKTYHSILIEIYACRQVFYDYLNIA